MSEALPATTTAQEDLTTLGQRRVNLIWEFTQAAVTIIITLAFVAAVFMGSESAPLTYGFFMVLATYLARTNHTKIGGVGPNERGR